MSSFSFSSVHCPPSLPGDSWLPMMAVLNSDATDSGVANANGRNHGSAHTSERRNKLGIVDCESKRLLINIKLRLD
jgi:hypothetical protein